MSEKFCVYCQEVTTHFINEYIGLECSNCGPLSGSESEYESDSSSGDPTYVPDSESDSDQMIFITSIQ